MAIFITRTVVIPVWLLGCALIVVLGAPSWMAATGLLLLISGLAATSIGLLGKNGVHPTVFDGATIDVRPLTVMPAPSVAPRSWPNSGFRNIGRGTKGG